MGSGQPLILIIRYHHFWKLENLKNIFNKDLNTINQRLLSIFIRINNFKALIKDNKEMAEMSKRETSNLSGTERIRLDPEQESELREAFDLFDRDGDKKIAAKELHVVM